MIGLAGDGGGKGHLNFLPGVLAGDGDGGTPAGSGLVNGLTEYELVSTDGVAGAGIGCGWEWLTVEVASLLTADTFLLQQWPMTVNAGDTLTDCSRSNHRTDINLKASALG